MAGMGWPWAVRCLAGWKMCTCEIWGTDYGLEVKVQKGRGGYIRNVRAEHCLLDQFLVHSVEYNADGEAAPGLSPVEEVSVSDCRFYQA